MPVRTNWNSAAWLDASLQAEWMARSHAKWRAATDAGLTAIALGLAARFMRRRRTSAQS
jgi:hypothetical protein